MIRFLVLLLLTINTINAKYDGFSIDQKKVLFNSDSRIIVNLAGTWQLTTSSGELKSIEVPLGIKSKEKLTYERTIKIQQELIKTKTWHLYFLGVNSDVEVYANGQYIGRYLGAMTPLKVPIPSKYIDGENLELKLIINPSENFTKLNEQFGIQNKQVYNGIVRDLFLIGTSKIWIDQVNFTSTYDLKSNQAKAKTSFKINTAEIDGDEELATQEISGIVELIDPSTGATVFQRSFTEKKSSERSSVRSIDMKISSPRLWSFGEANLYNLRITISSDEFQDDITKKVGIRELSINEENKFVFNGKTLFLKSVDYYEDYHNSNGSVPIKVIENDILQLKKLGVNSVRYKSVTPHPYFVELCNKYGIILFIDRQVGRIPELIYQSDEIQVRLENISKMSEAALGSAPSITSWGTGFYNINNNVELHKSYLNYRVIDIDDTFESSGHPFLIVEIRNAIKSIEEIKKRLIYIRSKFNGPIVVSIGTPVQIGNDNGYSDRLSVDYQANLIRNIFYLVKSEEFAGILVNSFNDYDLNYPLLISNNKNKYKASFGLFDSKRKPRIAYQILSSLLNSEKEPLLNSGSWTDRTNYLFIIIGFIVIVVLLFLLNRLRRFREYFIRSLVRPHNFYSDVRDQRLISTIQTFILSVFISFTVGIYLTDLLYFHRFDLNTQYLLMLFVRNPEILDNIFDLIWRPELLMIIISSVIFLVFYLVSTLLKIISVFVRSRIFFHDTLTITVWSAIPMIFLLPPALVSNRLLSIHPIITLVFVVIFIVFLFWFLSRLMKSTSVVFDVAFWKSYTIGIGLLIVFILVFLSIYQINYSFLDYVDIYLESLA